MFEAPIPEKGAGLKAFNADQLSLAAVRLSDVDLGLAHVLDYAEQDRVRTFRSSAQRDRFMAGRIALRLHIGALTGESPSSLKAYYLCPSCRNQSSQAHGIPQYQLASLTSPLRASLSRSGNWCLLAGSLDDDIVGVGVDIENESSANFDGFEAVAMTARERGQLRSVPPLLETAFKTRLWVRKEAVLKALGTGLAIDPSRVDVSGSNPAVLGMPPMPEQWHVGDINPLSVGLPKDFAAALALRRARPKDRHSDSGP